MNSSIWYFAMYISHLNFKLSLTEEYIGSIIYINDSPCTGCVNKA